MGDCDAVRGLRPRGVTLARAGVQVIGRQPQWAPDSALLPWSSGHPLSLDEDRQNPCALARILGESFTAVPDDLSGY